MENAVWFTYPEAERQFSVLRTSSIPLWFVVGIFLSDWATERVPCVWFGILLLDCVGIDTFCASSTIQWRMSEWIWIKLRAKSDFVFPPGGLRTRTALIALQTTHKHTRAAIVSVCLWCLPLTLSPPSHIACALPSHAISFYICMPDATLFARAEVKALPPCSNGIHKHKQFSTKTLLEYKY